MPRGDGTGPMGMGPFTGRGAGYCAGYNTAGYANLGCCAGARRGFFSPHFYRYPAGINFAQVGSIPDRKDVLKRQAEDLEYRLNEIKRQLSEDEK